eukprot:scaffold295913_cov15-Prasinocladus_malaysianus.AAC.1
MAFGSRSCMGGRQNITAHRLLVGMQKSDRKTQVVAVTDHPSYIFGQQFSFRIHSRLRIGARLECRIQPIAER